jgi:SP family arabinose:H+ symporter-like MFS transporter
MVAIGLMAFSQLSGINAITYYSTKIFTAAGGAVRDSFTATAIVGFVNLLATFVTVAFVDRAGRRGLLLIGLTIQTLALSVVGAMFHAHVSAWPLLVPVLCFTAAFNMALGPIPWIVCSEIFPTRIRGRAMSLATFTIWTACYIVAQTFPMLNDSPMIGPAKTFWVYAAFSLGALLFVLAKLPETKGRTLEEIEAMWQRGGRFSA